MEISDVIVSLKNSMYLHKVMQVNPTQLSFQTDKV